MSNFQIQQSPLPGVSSAARTSKLVCEVPKRQAVLATLISPEVPEPVG